MWKADVRETKEELAKRGLEFMNWYETVNSLSVFFIIFVQYEVRQMTCYVCESLSIFLIFKNLPQYNVVLLSVQFQRSIQVL